MLTSRWWYNDWAMKAHLAADKVVAEARRLAAEPHCVVA